jgi:hypothetical protein
MDDKQLLSAASFMLNKRLHNLPLDERLCIWNLIHRIDPGYSDPHTERFINECRDVLAPMLNPEE